MPPFDPERWASLASGADCPVCREHGIDAAAVVATRASGPVTLQNDAALRGYCILYHRRHVTELFQLDPVERRQFIDDLVALAAAISAVCRPDKLNYAILGNEVPHLHGHVIPRYRDDGWWGQPIWLRPAAARRSLPVDEFVALRAALAEAL